jgi:catechol 2,3-dioxygenase-like lactoylglutathione lyase family enzyme
MGEMEAAQVSGSRISDICLLVQDLERAVTFYRDQVGFKLRRRAPGFADFFTGGVTLALWQVDHMQSHLHLPPGPAPSGGWRTMAAIQVDSSERVHLLQQELSARGVPFLVEPQAYPWNAYACYFKDPEDNLWEIYTWQPGGHANLIFNGEQ